MNMYSFFHDLLLFAATMMSFIVSRDIELTLTPGRLMLPCDLPELTAKHQGARRGGVALVGAGCPGWTRPPVRVADLAFSPRERPSRALLPESLCRGVSE